MKENNKLKKIEDQGLIYTLLQSTKDQDHEVWFWRMVGETKHLVPVKLEVIRKARADFAIVAEKGHESSVKDLIGGSSFMDIYVPESALLLRARLKQFEQETGRFYLEVPEFVAQVERRKNYRLNVFGQEKVMLQFSKNILQPRPQSQLFLKSCFDISAGGFSFLVSKLEAKYFKTGDKVSSMQLKIGDRNIPIDANIVLIREIEPDTRNGLNYKVWRICCKFEKIDEIQKKFLEKYIFERIKDELSVING